MRRWRGAAGLAAAALLAHPRAAAAWTACRIEQGVLVVPAKAAGLNGAFILDTGAARSVLDATQASLAGLDGPEASVPILLDGRRFGRVDVAVAPLDARTRTQPTPITGILGDDVLQGLVLQVLPDPCRFRLTTRPERTRPLARLPVVLLQGAPHVEASLSDGATGLRGLFRVSTGVGLGVRLGPLAARLGGAAAAGGAGTQLRALSLGGLLFENLPAGVAADELAGADGEIGASVWLRQGFELDVAGRRLTLFAAPTKKTRRSSSGGS